MKTITSILVMFILSTQVNAQLITKKIKGNEISITVLREVSNYDKIIVSGSLYIELFKGDEGKITIKADENLTDYIITEVKNGELKIKTENGYQINSNKKITITIPFDVIDEISLAGSGNINSEDILNTKDLKLSLAGSGIINVPVSSKILISNIAGSGIINVSGETDDFSCNVAGSGNINGYDLIAKKTTVKIAGSGNVSVNALNEIYANITGSGNVYYIGNPGIEKGISFGSGSIKKKS
jgi:hypothetical protein